MLAQRVLCTKLISRETSLCCIQSSSITSRTHVKDYRPRPARSLPKRPFIPPRKKDAFLTHPTPTIDPFQTSFQPVKEFQSIQQYDDDDDDTTKDDDNDEQFRNIWPYKKWLWRSDKNFEGKRFDPKKTLEWFVDDENNNVGRAWYITELRYKVIIHFLYQTILWKFQYFSSLNKTKNKK